MITLRAHETGQSLGTLSDDDTLVLRRNLESAASESEYYLDVPTLGLLAERGLAPHTVAMLREAVGSRDGLTVTLEGALEEDGAEGSSDPGQAVFVNEQPLICVVCRHEQFRRQRAQLHSAMASFVNLEWLGPTADCYICTRCGYVHWFIPPR